MNTLLFLILFPFCIAILAAVLPAALGTLRRSIGVIANIVLCVVPIYLLITYLDKGPAYFQIETHVINIFMLVIEVLIAAYIVYISIRAKRYLPVLLVVVQSVIMLTLSLLPAAVCTSSTACLWISSPSSWR